MISSVHLAYYGVSRAKDWVSVDYGTRDLYLFISKPLKSVCHETLHPFSSPPKVYKQVEKDEIK